MNTEHAFSPFFVSVFWGVWERINYFDYSAAVDGFLVAGGLIIGQMMKVVADGVYSRSELLEKSLRPSASAKVVFTI